MADFGSALWNKPTSGDTGEGGGASDPVTRSLQFDRASTQKLTRTFTTPTSQKKVTISWWMKLAEQGDGSTGHGGIVSTGSHYTNYTAIKVGGGATNSIVFDEVAGGAYKSDRSTSRAFRDMGAWMHCVHVIDTTDSTADDRSKLYINGVRYTGTFATSYATYTQNFDTQWSESGVTISIGEDSSAAHFGGYLADIYYIDGQALDASDFAETNSSTGQWVPKEYSGTYGNQGFHLDFKEDGATTSSNAGIGKDVSGNGNYFATTSISRASLDTPTKNYATLNPLAQSTYSLTNGNLECIRDASSAQSYTTSTIGVNSSSATTSKWYWEVYAKTISSDYPRVGISSYYSRGGDEPTTNYLCGDTDGTGRAWASKNGSGNIAGESHAGMKFNGSNTGSAFVDYDQGDILQFALDLDNNKLWCGKNGTWYTDDASTTTTASAISGNTATPAFSDLSGHTWGPAIFCNANADVFILNAGADPTFAGNKSSGQDTSQSEFYYAPPTGFQSLNTGNLGTPAVTPSEHFNTVLYNGTYDSYYGVGTSSQSITGVGFSPGIVWVKDRDGLSATYSSSYNGHYWLDTLLGTGGAFNIDRDNSSHSGTSLASGEDGISSFDSDGFTVDEAEETNFLADLYGNGAVTFAERYVAWCWKLGTTASSWSGGGQDPDTEHYNSDAGISIINYYDGDGNGTSISINHSLGEAPEFAISMDYGDYTGGHHVWHKDLSANNYLDLSGDGSQSSDSTYFPSSPATNTTFTGGSSIVDSNTSHIVLFRSVEGFSKFGSYVGNLSSGAAAPFIYLGFRPKFIMVKNIQDSGHAWYIHDTARSPHNYSDLELTANSSGAEYSVMSAASVERMDILSNGFKLRGNNVATNANGKTHIYAAFSESPFSKSLAR